MAEQSKQLTPLDRKVQKIGNWIYTPSFQLQLQRALPQGHEATRFARLILNEVRREPKLADCTIDSLLGVAMACAQTGLEPGPTGLCFVIPYKNEATFQLGYKGMLNLSWRSEGIIGVASEVVRENDPVFEFDEGSDAYVRFQRLLKGPRGEPIAVFAALKSAGGGNICRIMTFEEIEDHRKRYVKTKRDDQPWITAWDEQACKTVLKRAAKRAPVSSVMLRAMEWDGLAESGKPQNLEAEITKAEPMVTVKCPTCEGRASYPIPYDGLCANCDLQKIVVPENAEIDPDTGEMIPPEAA